MYIKKSVSRVCTLYKKKNSLFFSLFVHSIACFHWVSWECFGGIRDIFLAVIWPQFLFWEQVVEG